MKIEADVLKWEVSNGGMSGPQAEKNRVKDELIKIFSFCVCLGGYISGYGHGTQLIRS